ncbi:MAG: hypothetical protein R3D29_16525 [Nitratireductor sp.]
MEDLSIEPQFSCDEKVIRDADVVIVCVPTPVMRGNRPDYRPVLAASRMIGRNLKPGAVVVYESTVDREPQRTVACLCWRNAQAFSKAWISHIGYSPERVSPGERTRLVGDIKKIVVAGSTPQVSDFLEQLYSRVVTTSDAFQGKLDQGRGSRKNSRKYPA